MRVSLSWLRDFVPLELALEDLVGTLDDLGLAVESVDRVGEGLDGVVVARVETVGAIKGADRIRAVEVDAGDGAVQVVCGAWNFEPGDLVPFATVGSVLPGGFAIGLRKMKGVESNGMLCAPDELGLPGGHDGILVLSPGLALGTPVADALGLGPDVVFDLEITANRPDAMSVAGVARDLAARLRLPFSLPEPPTLPEGDVPTASLATATVDAPDLCGRFVAQALGDVVVGPSAPWLASRLARAGMRPINNVVDASNYVMLELGVPNHAYDLALLPGRGLRVRRASAGEAVVTLDGVPRRLEADDCLICDADDEPVGIAGIMGGASSEISSGTTEVLLEAAWWLPTAIARTSRRLKLRTEASARFERGADPEAIDRAVARFCELLAPTGARPAPGVIDVRGELPPGRVVHLRTPRLNALLGTALTGPEVEGHLEALGFATAAVPGGEDTLEVTVPSWRPDSAVEIDLVEEVARLNGYSKIAKTVPGAARTGGLTPHQTGRRLVRSILAGVGADEAWSPTFLSAADLEGVGLDPSEAVVVANPLVAEERLLRPTLLPGLLAAIAYNAGRRNLDVSLFEVGRVFLVPEPGSPLPEERENVAIALAGREAPAAVAVWDAIVEGCTLEGTNLEPSTAPGLHPTRTARLSVGPEVVGVLGEVDPDALASAGVGERVAWLEVDLERLLAARQEPVYRAVSRYPSSDIDLAFEVDEGVPAAAIDRSLREAGDGLVADVRLFDVYRGEQVLAGRRSLAYTVRFQAEDHTLTVEEVAAARRRLIEVVESAHPAALRG